MASEKACNYIACTEVGGSAERGPKDEAERPQCIVNECGFRSRSRREQRLEQSLTSCLLRTLAAKLIGS